jgi:DNA-binding transcriptional LysR family regulator
VPTACEALFKHSVAAFDELVQSGRDISFLASPMVGELRTGCQVGRAVGIMPPAVMRFSKLYPRVVLFVDELPTRASQRATLLDRKCNGDTEQGLDVEPIFNKRIAVVASIHSRLARRRKIDLTELLDGPRLSLHSAHGIRHISRTFPCPRLGMPKNAVCASSNPTCCRWLIHRCPVPVVIEVVLCAFRFERNYPGIRRIGPGQSSPSPKKSSSQPSGRALHLMYPRGREIGC